MTFVVLSVGAGGNERGKHCYLDQCQRAPTRHIVPLQRAIPERQHYAEDSSGSRDARHRLVSDRSRNYNSTKVGVMQKQKEPKPESGRLQVGEQVAAAYLLLKTMQDKVGQHPEIEQAINKLETALAILGLQTGGML